MAIDTPSYPRVYRHRQNLCPNFSFEVVSRLHNISPFGASLTRYVLIALNLPPVALNTCQPRTLTLAEVCIQLNHR